MGKNYIVEELRIIESTRRSAIYRRSKFTFRCKRCGKCCVTISGLSLSPYDVFRLSKERGCSQTDFINQYCNLDTRQAAVPAILLRAPRGRCPFYDDAEGCTAYAARPLVCRLFPIGYLYDGDKREALYFPKGGYGCLDGGDDYTLGQWLDAAEPSVRMHFQWFLDYMDLSEEIESACSHGALPPDRYEKVVASVMNLINDYRHEEAFEDQYRKNKQMIRKAERGIFG